MVHIVDTVTSNSHAKNDMPSNFNELEALGRVVDRSTVKISDNEKRIRESGTWPVR